MSSIHTQVVRLGTGPGQGTTPVSAENPLPVAGSVSINSGTKVAAVANLAAGGTGIIGWLSQIWQTLTGTLSVSATARVCLGTSRVTVPTSAVTLASLMAGAAFPAGTVAVELQADGGTVRIRRDGGIPTTTLGYRLDDGTVLTVDSSPTGIRVIASVATALNVACFDRV